MCCYNPDCGNVPAGYAVTGPATAVLSCCGEPVAPEAADAAGRCGEATVGTCVDVH